LLLAVADALAFLVVIPEEPALSEVEWGICFCLCNCFWLSFRSAAEEFAFVVAIASNRYLQNPV
jgi:hypothetical protein